MSRPRKVVPMKTVDSQDLTFTPTRTGVRRNTMGAFQNYVFNAASEENSVDLSYTVAAEKPIIACTARKLLGSVRNYWIPFFMITLKWSLSLWLCEIVLYGSFGRYLSAQKSQSVCLDVYTEKHYHSLTHPDHIGISCANKFLNYTSNLKVKAENLAKESASSFGCSPDVDLWFPLLLHHSEWLSNDVSGPSSWSLVWPGLFWPRVLRPHCLT